MHKMLYSINTSVATEKVGIEKGIEMLCDAGFPALDFTFVNDYSFALGDNSIEYAKELRNLAGARGVIFNQAHAPFKGGYDVYVKQHIPAMPKIIEFAGAFGAKNIVIHPIVKQRHYGFEREHFDMNMKFYSSLAPYAKSAGIKIAIENMWSNHPVTKRIERSVCSDPDEHIRYLEALNDPETFTICIDTGHSALVGREPEQVIREIGGERLGAIHAHDVDYINDLHSVPGTAKLNFDEICRALAEVNYRGDFTLEIKGFIKNYPTEALPIALRFMAETARYYSEKLLL